MNKEIPKRKDVIIMKSGDFSGESFTVSHFDPKYECFSAIRQGENYVFRQTEKFEIQTEKMKKYKIKEEYRKCFNLEPSTVLMHASLEHWNSLNVSIESLEEVKKKEKDFEVKAIKVDSLMYGSYNVRLIINLEDRNNYLKDIKGKEIDFIEKALNNHIKNN